jgi:uncharacterized repeat protein (TIGR01451 family)
MKKFNLACRLVMAAVFCTLCATLPAQEVRTPRETALRFLQENPAKFGLAPQDVADVRVTKMYSSKHNGLTHVWLNQQHQGIPVYNGLFGLHVRPDGQVRHLQHRFVANLAARVNTTAPSLSAYKALEMSMLHLGFQGFSTPSLRQKINDQNWVFEGGAISRSDIPVHACYVPQRDGSLRLAWMLVIAQANTSDVWSIRVDAQHGTILDKVNRTVYCQAGHAHGGGTEAEHCDQTTAPHAAAPQENAANESYRVFPLPVESPAHGSRELVNNPADAIASPFGWLDNNGVDGPEFGYTRGNNAWSYEDSANDNTGTQAESAQGTNSVFDFPFDPNAEPESNRSAAITNLFYMVNKMHDFSYRFGFDEASGNFQTNNYGRGGIGNDPVLAEALDGSGQDNANFSTPPDGFSGRMQMFKWARQGGNLLTVNAPGVIIGTYGVGLTNGFGPAITSTPVTGDVVFVNDGSGSDAATLGCAPYPAGSLLNKIALVDRGECTFVSKIKNAQNAGARACIICNFEDNTVPMGGNDGTITIPAVMLKKSDCDLLRQYASTGVNVSLVLPPVSGPSFLDGDFDNGFIAHEYGHGISNRLTGDNALGDCLPNVANNEQMGEGWSDFFTLVTTVKPGDVATQRRGIGTFVTREPNNGRGIRRYPYTTDMSINPVDYSWVALTPGTPGNAQPHPRGEIWAATLWDLYWAMVEKYGFDPDLNNPESGNFRAVQLVMDGMKLQPCEPGNLDGRDAIIAADLENYAGADTCLIMNVFARRGMGVNAVQGLSSSATDQVANFDPIPTCIKELKIKKETTTPTIEHGGNADFRITVTNHKDETANNVVVTDVLPQGLSLVSASNGGSASNGIVTWNLGNMASGQVVTLTYTAKSANGLASQRIFADPMDSDEDWISANTEGAFFFLLQNTTVKVGTGAWRVRADTTETDITLETIQSFTVGGAQPVVRFWHRYNTEFSADAGFMEMKEASQINWKRFAKDKLLRNGYPGDIQYGTFAIPFLSGFSGNSNGWVQSYINLSDFAGQEVAFRFRFGTDDNTTVPGDAAWYVDEMEALDLFNYNSEACVTADGGDQACAQMAEAGVVVNPLTVSTSEPDALNAFDLMVQPNPASDMLYLSASQSLEGALRATLTSMDGRLLLLQTAVGLAKGQPLALDVQQVPPGMYLLRLESAAGSAVQKVVVR